MSLTGYLRQFIFNPAICLQWQSFGRTVLLSWLSVLVQAMHFVLRFTRSNELGLPFVLGP
jgi:hypothetical protein